MKVGILNVLNSRASQVDWGGSPVVLYARFLDSAEKSLEYEGYEIVSGAFPDSVDACDAYLITGSPTGVYDDDPWLEPLAQFIRDSYAAHKKLVGICFGHQMLAYALGGHAEKSDKGWGLGLKSFEITGTKPWMSDADASCSLYFVHQDQVVALPPDAELLGGNAFCPNALFTIDDRVLSMQGHPEFSAELMTEILDSAEKRANPQRHQTAIESLHNGSPDNVRMATWIANFLLS